MNRHDPERTPERGEGVAVLRPPRDRRGGVAEGVGWMVRGLALFLGAITVIWFMASPWMLPRPISVAPTFGAISLTILAGGIAWGLWNLSEFLILPSARIPRDARKSGSTV